MEKTETKKSQASAGNHNKPVISKGQVQQMLEDLHQSETDMQQLKWVKQSHEDILDFLYNLQLVFPKPYFEKLRHQKLLPFHDWPYVLQVNYKTFEGLKCPICLMDYYEMVVPHMAFCGHIYCLPCILRHLLTSSTCPLCKEEIQKSLLKYADFELTPKVNPGAIMVFSLVRRNEETNRFESQNENSHLDMIGGLELEAQQSLLDKELRKLLDYQEENCEAIQADPLLAKALEESIHIIMSKGEAFFDLKAIEEYFGKSPIRKKAQGLPQIEEGGLFNPIDPPNLKRKASRTKSKQFHFFQDIKGSNTYLHYICQEFLDLSVGPGELPKTIKGAVIESIPATQGYKLRKSVKYLSHLPENTEIRFVFIRMDDLLDKKTLGEYIRAYQSFKREQEQQKKKEEEMLERFYGKSKKKKRESSFDDYKAFYATPAPPSNSCAEETPESLEANKNNRDMFPVLDSKPLTGPLYTDSLVELENRRLTEKTEMLRRKKELEQLDREESDNEDKHHIGGITIIRQAKKKKKGRK